MGGSPTGCPNVLPNVTERLSQMYIRLRAHLTLMKLFKNGDKRGPRDHGDLIDLLCRCPKLHLYWRKALDTLNRVFQVTISQDPKSCLLGILNDLQVEDVTKQAIARAPFEARKLILRHWKSTDPPSWKEWVAQMGGT